jgi:hypothetical protein
MREAIHHGTVPGGVAPAAVARTAVPSSHTPQAATRRYLNKPCTGIGFDVLTGRRIDMGQTGIVDSVAWVVSELAAHRTS